tara:strand:+ start:149 stop:616 length:468 start_codon:yes stop_codon:yes gene_type:complete
MNNVLGKPFYLMLIIACFLVSSVASARTITECGEFKGFAAYLKNGVVGQQGDFSKDEFSGSKIILEAKQNASNGKTEVDIVFYNRGTPYRASKDGPVYLMNYNPTNNTWMILAVASTFTDTYLFYLDTKGRGEVVWTNSRSGGAPKAVLMRAKCG